MTDIFLLSLIIVIIQLLFEIYETRGFCCDMLFIKTMNLCIIIIIDIIIIIKDRKGNVYTLIDTSSPSNKNISAKGFEKNKQIPGDGNKNK